VKKDYHPVWLSHTSFVLPDSSRITANMELTGPIPSEIGNLSALDNLFLCEWASINHVEKKCQPVRLSHTFLALLDSSRMTDHNALTGPIPSEIGNASALIYLYSCEWATMNCVKKKFHPVRLSHTILVLLDFSRMTANNDLTGPIPSEIGNLSALEYLYLCECASMNRVKKKFYPVRLSHTFLVLLDSSRTTDNNTLTDPMPHAEIASLPLQDCILSLSKLFGEMFIIVVVTSR
jgi:hypothetical protein